MSPRPVRGTAGDDAVHGREGFLDGFEQRLGFPLDRFQRRSMEAIDRGSRCWCRRRPARARP